MRHQNAFTLIELLIVIAIIAILGSATVLVLNPVEIIKQGRDGTRITDVENIQKSLNLTLFNNPSLVDSLLSTNIYLSLPSGSCPLSPPTGYTYVCNATSANINKTDGTGWIPLTLQNMASLPTDPNSNFYYAFIANPTTKTFTVTALLESEKQTKLSAAKDGGTDPGRFEKGDTGLWSGASGLVAYYPFDGFGTIINGQTTGLQDLSGKNNNGTAYNTNGTGLAFTSGKANSAIQFDGVDDYVIASGGTSMISSGATIISSSAWVNKSSNGVIAHQNGPIFFEINGGKFGSSNEIYTSVGWKSVNTGVNILQNGEWYYLVITYDGANIRNYVNGVIDSITPHSGILGSMPLNCLGIGRGSSGGCNGVTPWGPINAKVDELKVFNKVLTPDEILANYNAHK